MKGIKNEDYAHCFSSHLLYSMQFRHPYSTPKTNLSDMYIEFSARKNFIFLSPHAKREKTDIL